MRKWRPTHKCIYVIPEVHGAIESLNIIFSRILPLRSSKDQEDVVILLGDYIDEGSDSATVIDTLIECKREYGDRFLCIKGNHEILLLKALQSDQDYRAWILQGGVPTIKSYLDKLNLDSDPSSFPFSRLSDIIPTSHIDFLNSLPTHIVLEDYVLFHGGFDLSNSENTADSMWAFDTQSSRNVKRLIKEKPLATETKIYVGAHNFKSRLPYIYSKYFMLGGGAPSKLILFELNSMTCAMIKQGKSRIYKHNFKYIE